MSSLARLRSTKANSPPWLSRKAVRMLSCLRSGRARQPCMQEAQCACAPTIIRDLHHRTQPRTRKRRLWQLSAEMQPWRA